LLKKSIVEFIDIKTGKIYYSTKPANVEDADFEIIEAKLFKAQNGE